MDAEAEVDVVAETDAEDAVDVEAETQVDIEVVIDVSAEVGCESFDGEVDVSAEYVTHGCRCDTIFNNLKLAFVST